MIMIIVCKMHVSVLSLYVVALGGLEGQYRTHRALGLSDEVEKLVKIEWGTQKS